MKKVLLTLLTILGLTSCSSLGLEQTFTNSSCNAHVQTDASKVAHFNLKESFITQSGVVKGTTRDGIPVILSPGTYVLYKSEYCVVCNRYGY